jgi:hypothetical protein
MDFNTNKSNSNFKSFTIDYRINRLDVRENVEIETKNKPYVLWGNVNNDYPQFLLQVKEASPVLSVAIDSKVNMSIGDGVEIEGMGNVMVNKYETLTELYYKLVYDYWIFGGWATETIPNRENTSVESIYHLPFQNIRVGKREYDDHDRDLDWFYYSTEWQLPKQNKKIIKFHSLDFDRRGEARQIYYWKNYSPSDNEHYPITPYQAGINAAVIEAEVFDWHKRNLATSLMPNLFVSLVGSPTPEEKEIVYEELIRSYQGKTGQKIMLAFSDTPEGKPEITPIQNNANDTFYTEVLNMCVQSILTANQISSPLLLGISTFGSNPFSQNADELVVATKHMMEMVIKPALKKINQSLENLLSLKYNRPVKIVNKLVIPNFAS